LVRILSREIRESTLLFSIRLNSSDNFGSLKFIILSLTIFHSIQIFLDNPLKGMGGGKEGIVQYVTTARLKLNFLK
jgi:hypothetical protein|tara:strand:- start:68 stop:295 length:228 start_codon:yes stop_codon:yes gene_type:complete